MLGRLKLWAPHLAFAFVVSEGQAHVHPRLPMMTFSFAMILNC